MRLPECNIYYHRIQGGGSARRIPNKREVAGRRGGSTATTFELPYLAGGGGTQQCRHTLPSELDDQEPWFERAWTMQEGLLSNRRLQFGTKQTTWNCQYGEVQYKDCDGWLAAQFNSYTNWGDKELLDNSHGR